MDNDNQVVVMSEVPTSAHSSPCSLNSVIICPKVTNFPSSAMQYRRSLPSITRFGGNGCFGLAESAGGALEGMWPGGNGGGGAFLRFGTVALLSSSKLGGGALPIGGAFTGGALPIGGAFTGGGIVPPISM